MRRVWLLWFFAGSVWADTVTVLKDTPAYQAPKPESAITFYILKGEKISTSEVSIPEYLRFRVNRGGKWRGGYVLKTDVAYESTNNKKIGVGGGFQYTYLNQKAKTFETEDQVQYSTTPYTSKASSPFLVAQYNQENFWRAVFSVKQTKYTSSATTDIVGSGSKAVHLNHTFYSLLLQKAFNPFGQKMFYVGGGVEIAKATKVTIELGESQLPSSSTDLPLYLGGQLFGGGNVFILDSLSAYGEFRFTLIANQTPNIYETEVAGGLMFWF